MNKRKRQAGRCAALMLAALFAVSASACSPAAVPGSDLLSIAAEPAATFPVPDEVSDAAVAVSRGANEFAFRFTAQLLENADSGENFVCSPYSAWLPLAALVNAAQEEARPALLRALGSTGFDVDTVNSASKDMLAELTCAQLNYWREEDGLDPYDPLSIANAVFVDRTAKLNDGFARTFAEDYAGTSMSVDFSSSEAVDAVNAWADTHTGGLIPQVVQQFSPDTRAAAANAIYFSDQWDQKFDADLTRAGTFHSPLGDSEAQFMHRDGIDQLYYEDDALQAVQLPFQMGGSMLVLLPKNNDAAALLRTMNAGRLDEIVSGIVPAEGRLTFPRFRAAGDGLELSDVLETMGFDLFDSRNPVLTTLADGEDLFVSQAVQYAVIEVDEQGTTAASVTMLAVDGTGLVQNAGPFEMVCDRPFVFVLLGNGPGGTRQVLFTGLVNNPGD